MSKLLPRLVVITLVLPSWEATAQNTALESNAALKYWQAFAVMPQLDEQESRHFGGTPGGEYPPNYFGAPLNDVASGLIRRSETALQLLHRGARHTACAWGVDLDDGPHALLPHSSKVRHLSGLACLRARSRFERGQHTAAVEDVLAVLTLARHAGSDRTLAGMYVQWATEKEAFAITAAYLPNVPRRDLEHLSAKLDALPRGGSLQDALQVEKEYLLGWYVSELRSKQPRKSIEDIFGPDAQTLGVARAAAAPPEQLAELLEALEPHYDDLVRITDLSPEKRNDRFTSIQQSAQQASPLAKLFIPGYGVTFRNEPQARTRVAMFRAAVDIVLAGPEKVSAHTDPYGGAFEYRALGTGPAFELFSTLNVNGGRFAMKFGERTFTW